MSTATAPAPAGTGRDDPEILHLTCCDPDLAMCGEDVSEMSWSDGVGEVPCPLCAWVDGEYLPCPVPGCTPIRRVPR